jgi:small subunit ribosomal protein S17
MAEQEDTTIEETPAEPEATETESPEAVASEQAPESADADPAPEPEPEPAPAAEPEEVLDPKERRARARAAKAAKVQARGPVSPEERHAERATTRAAKAKQRQASRAKATAKAKASAHESAVTPPRERVAGNQKVRQGVVVSDKADKTITVRIDVTRRHPKYQKIVRTSQTLHAHDEANDAHAGDTVTIREARPLSRLKRWRLIDVIERAK